MHRDMEALSASGVPVFAMRGSRGGWQLDEGWRTQVPGLDETELRAFLMAQPQVVGDERTRPCCRTRAGEVDRCVAGISSGKGRRRFGSGCMSTPPAGMGRFENLSMLPVVQEAVSRDRKLKILYRPEGQDASERTIDPLGLVAKGTVWYLVAQTPRGFRTYRVSRIKEAKLLDQPCDRPHDFDLAAYWKSSTTQFRERPRYNAILRLEPRTAETMKNWGCFSRTETGQDGNPDGWVTVRAQFADEDDACFIVLGLGPRAEILDPAKLRERVAADIARMFERSKER